MDAPTTRRRGAPTAELAPALALLEGFVDQVDDDEPLANLGGELPRVWAPFVLIGV